MKLAEMASRVGAHRVGVQEITQSIVCLSGGTVSGIVGGFLLFPVRAFIRCDRA